MGLFQDSPSFSSICGFVEIPGAGVVNNFPVRACRDTNRTITREGRVGMKRGLLLFKRSCSSLPLCEDNSREENTESSQDF
jgi:hypothetical protein